MGRSLISSQLNKHFLAKVTFYKLKIYRPNVMIVFVTFFFFVCKKIICSQIIDTLKKNVSFPRPENSRLGAQICVVKFPSWTIHKRRRQVFLIFWPPPLPMSAFFISVRLKISMKFDPLHPSNIRRRLWMAPNCQAEPSKPYSRQLAIRYQIHVRVKALGALGIIAIFQSLRVRKGHSKVQVCTNQIRYFEKIQKCIQLQFELQA